MYSFFSIIDNMGCKLRSHILWSENMMLKKINYSDLIFYLSASLLQNEKHKETNKQTFFVLDAMWIPRVVKMVHSEWGPGNERKYIPCIIYDIMLAGCDIWGLSVIKKGTSWSCFILGKRFRSWLLSTISIQISINLEPRWFSWSPHV